MENIGNEVNDIKLYPNPATNTLTIDAGKNTISSIIITDATGREVFRNDNVKAQNQSIPVSSLPAGIYIIKLGLGNGSYIAKFMKQ